jgi:hypothetical protein
MLSNHRLMSFFYKPYQLDPSAILHSIHQTNVRGTERGRYCIWFAESSGRSLIPDLVRHASAG